MGLQPARVIVGHGKVLGSKLSPKTGGVEKGVTP